MRRYMRLLLVEIKALHEESMNPSVLMIGFKKRTGLVSTESFHKQEVENQFIITILVSKTCKNSIN